VKGADQCPRCGSRKSGAINNNVASFYADENCVCANCGTAWEPFDPADLLDEDMRYSSFKKPCNNCAFRKGSPEQADKEAWSSTLLSLEMGGSFHCHKGVPITPGDGHGFAYPKHDKSKRNLRTCRGYLNSIVLLRMREFAEEDVGGSLPDEPWKDSVGAA
jgi:transcription elongation factor Elf1